MTFIFGGHLEMIPRNVNYQKVQNTVVKQCFAKTLTINNYFRTLGMTYIYRATYCICELMCLFIRKRQIMAKRLGPSLNVS